MFVLNVLLIFALRIVDVSLGALRISMLFRGRRGLAGLFGFFESLVWLIAASLVLGNLDSPLKFIAYASGYAAGTMLGSTIDQWIAIGNSLVRIVTPVGSQDVASVLRDAGHHVTTVSGQGLNGGVQVSLSVVPRRSVRRLMTLVHQVNPEAFMTHEETIPYRLTVAPAVSVRK